jgi:methionyl aminopeptidase
MITIKNEKEFEKMAVAGRAVAAVHEAVVAAADVGVSLLDLDEVAAQVIRDHDCTPSFLGYHGFPNHICTSPNDVIVHGIPSSYKLREGDIISIDAGAIFEGYHGDAALTFGVGEISDDAKRLLDVTNRALWAGIDQVFHGSKTGDVGHAVEQVAIPAGLGVVREYVGHGIGRSMHESPQVPNYGTPGGGHRLKKGMAICIEPMFNLGGAETRTEDDGWTVVTGDGSLSAHFEHTIAITADGPKVTTVSDLLTSRPTS